METGKLRTPYTCYDHVVHRVAVTPDGSTIVLALNDQRTVQIWDPTAK